jgi:ABC-type glycerol-3-phosphate transport system substrate-binding protein
MTLWFSGTTAMTEFLRGAIEEYNAAQSDIRITLVQTPPSREAIATALAGRQGPDIMWYNHNMPWFFGIEAVYPLNEFVTDAEIGIDPAQVFPPMRLSAQYGGVVMAVPMSGCPGALLYNREIFRNAGLSDTDAPQTWDDVRRLANQLTIRDGDTIRQYGLVNGAVDWMLQEINLSNGSDWSSEDMSTYITHPDRLVEGLEWWSALHHEDGVMPVPSGVTWAGVEALQVGSEAFVRGEAAMRGFASICDIATMLDDNPDLDIGAVLTPLGPSAEGVRRVSPGMDGFFVMANNPNPRDAYLFIRWFFEEKAVDFAKISPGRIPSVAAALDDPEFLESPFFNFGQVLEDFQAATLRNFHNFPGRLDVRSQEPAMAETVFLRRATPQQAVDRFLTHARQVFDLYREDLDEFVANYEVVW